MKTFISVLLGLFLGALGYHYLYNQTQNAEHLNSEPKPLYWVAPMDDNYRRDAPGKSPMGMDLVPVFAKDSGTKNNTSPGTVSINPQIENQIAVKVGEVFYGSLQQNTVSEGILRYDDTATHHVHAKTKGWIKDLQVDSHGDWVKKGQLLYRLYTPEWVNAQQELLFAIKQNNKPLILAAEQRLKILQFPDQVIKEIKHAKQTIEDVPFYAHQSGYVSELKVQSGHVVNPSDTLMIITDNKTLWLDAAWFSQDAINITPGTKITAVSNFFNDQQWHGQIDHIYPSADVKNRNVLTRIALENTDGRLKANMAMTVYLDNPSKENRLLVPREAVIQTAQQNRVVLSLGSGSYKSIAVELGQQNDAYFEVLSGLKAKDQVVTSAQFLIDSESSKSSDFIRMGDTQWPWAQVNGVIQHIDKPNRTLTIHREAISKWNRPAATLKFVVENGVNINHLDINNDISFKFEIRSGQFIITQLEVLNHD